MLRIEPVSPRQQGRALEVLAGRRHAGQVSAFADMLAAHGRSQCRLWWARSLRRPRAAALTVRNPGGTAMIFHTPAAGCDGALLARLLGALTDAVLAEGATFVQALLSPPDTADADAFARAGYEFLAHLIYLRRSLIQPPGPPGAELTWERFRRGEEDRLGRIIGETYVNSRDCPELLGLRPMADVIAAHKSSGVFRPEWWWLPTREGECVGCILMNEVAGRPGTADIVYLGLRPVWRGRGFARAMIRHALGAAAADGVTDAHLAVDSSNAPAFQLYLEEGFEEADRKDVYIKRRAAEEG
jgi:ribosomal protein S18 acetylase RimI-like enzyme